MDECSSPSPFRLQTGRRGDSTRFSARTTAEGVLFFLVALAVVSGPGFFGKWYVSAEDQVPFFAAAYDPHLFFPGSNRMLMVLSFATEWLSTPMRIAEANFAIIAVSISAALAIFANTLVPRLFHGFCVSTLLVIITVFGGDMYWFYMDPVNPYLLAFSFALVLSVLLTTSAKRPWARWRLFIVLPLAIVTAGYNPSAPLLLLIFFGLLLLANGILSIGKETLSVSGLAHLVTRIVSGGKNLGRVDGFNQHQPAGKTDDG